MNGRDHPMAPTGSAASPSPRSRRLSGLVQGGSATALLIALMGMPLGPGARAGDTAAATDNQALKHSAGSLLAPSVIPDDVTALLPLLMTSPERKQFAADLEAAIRLGRVEEAERQLRVAIETGTLAIVLSDRLNEPSLLAALQTLDLRQEGGVASPNADARSDAGAGCSVAEALPGPDVAELQAALEQEKAQSNAALRELSSLTDELRKVQQAREADVASAASALSRAEQSEAALRQEREKSGTARQNLEIELASLRQDYSALQAQRDRDAGGRASAVSEARETLAREQERREAAVRELAAAQDAIRSLQAARDTDTGSMKAKLAELGESVRRERERADAAAGDLATARKQAADRQALAEREAAAGLASLRGDLAQEQKRTEAVTLELADTLDALRAAREIQGSGPAPLVFRLAASGAPGPLRLHAADDPAPAVQAVVVASAGGFDRVAPAALPDMRPAASLSANAENPAAGTAGIQKAGSVPLAIGTAKAEAPAAAATDDRLVRRADALIRSGDVSGARLLLERSMEEGNARAAFMLAETFDPHVLSELGTLGIRPDPAKARELYARALALGIRQAGERMQALK